MRVGVLNVSEAVDVCAHAHASNMRGWNRDSLQSVQELTGA